MGILSSLFGGGGGPDVDLPEVDMPEVGGNLFQFGTGVDLTQKPEMIQNSYEFGTGADLSQTYASQAGGQMGGIGTNIGASGEGYGDQSYGGTMAPPLDSIYQGAVSQDLTSMIPNQTNMYQTPALPNMMEAGLDYQKKAINPVDDMDSTFDFDADSLVKNAPPELKASSLAAHSEYPHTVDMIDYYSPSFSKIRNENPEFFKGLDQNPMATDAYKNRVRKIESGGNDLARSPLSSATGRYQFTKGTWQQMQKKYGKQDGTIGKPMTDPMAQEKLMSRLTDENRSLLNSSLGRSPKDYELYMAHQLGPEGAKKLINANDNALVTKSLIGSSPFQNPSFLTKNKRPLTAIEARQKFQGAFR